MESQKQSSPPGSATSCHPSIHREVVRITVPGSSSPFCSQFHGARPGNPHRPRWRRHPLEHPPPALPPPPPRPRHPASLYDLEGAPLALDLCQNPSGPALGQRKLCVRLRTPPFRPSCGKKERPGKKIKLGKSFIFYGSFKSASWEFKAGLRGRMVPTKVNRDPMGSSVSWPQGTLERSSFFDEEGPCCLYPCFHNFVFNSSAGNSKNESSYTCAW